MKRFLIAALAACAAALPLAAQQTADASDPKYSLTDNNILPPESFEFATRDMMLKGYESRYLALDSMAQRRVVPDPSEDVIVERLMNLPTTIEMPYNSVVRSYIDLYAKRKPGLTERVLGASLYYMPIFETALQKYELPSELKYLAIVESALNPTARSKAGAVGLWQFMPATAGDMGLEINSLVDQRCDPILASEAAARYLKNLYGIYGDWSLAIAAYNCGPGNINKAIRRSGQPKRDFWTIYNQLPRETQGYFPNFIAATYIMNYYGDHGISPALAKKPIVTDTVHVNRRVHFQQIADVLDIPIDEIRYLNPQYISDIVPGNVHTYVLTLPSVQAECYVANEDSIVNHNADLYARLDRVTPGGEVKTDASGTYVQELVVKYHTVRKGENLNTIAKAYGVTAASIRKANGIKGTRLKNGTRLKINTYERKYVGADTTSAQAQPAPIAQPADSAAVSAPAPEAQQQKLAAQEQAPAQQFTTYVVKAGDTLYKISQATGATVDAIRQANNLTNDNIMVGQRLKIPTGTAAVSKSKAPAAKAKTTKKKSRRSSKKRR